MSGIDNLQPAVKGKKIGSRAKAINEFCKGCIYDPLSGQGTWRQQVEACTQTECPLYPFRPKSEGRKMGETND